jgi:RpiB/LacA/LacB family sugar-phosphate isomerase
MKKVFMASDNTGLVIKKKLLTSLSVYDNIISNIIFEDLGPDKVDIIDYTFYTKILSDMIAEVENSMGILISWSSIGMSMIANKVDYVRAAVCLNVEMAKIAREELDANVICVANGFMTFEEIRDTVRKFISTKYIDNFTNVSRNYMIDNWR